MKYGYFCWVFFFLSATVRKFKEMISVQLFSMLQAISSRWARQAFCASRSSLCVWILMLWSSYRARNPTGTKTPVHNPESPPTTQQCRVTKHITNSLVLTRLHMQNLSPGAKLIARSSAIFNLHLGELKHQLSLLTLIRSEQKLWLTLTLI